MPFEDDIQEIKKEIIQSHNLIIKTDNLVKNLSAEIRQIQKKQEGDHRRTWINSIWAYVIFATLCFVGVYLGFEAKVDAVRRQKDDLQAELEKSRAEAGELQKKLSVRAQQEKAAEHLLKLKREKRDTEALKVAESLDANRLSPVLGRLVIRETEDLRQKMGQEALEAGKSLLQKGYLKRSLRQLDRVVAVQPPKPILADAHYQRGNLMLKLKKSAQAAEDFLAAANVDPKASFADLALYLAAGSLETSGDVPRALETYRQLVKEHGSSRWASQARRRITRLTPSKEREPKPAPVAPQPKPAGDKPTATEGKPKPAATEPAASKAKPRADEPAAPPPSEPPATPDPQR